MKVIDIKTFRKANNLTQSQLGDYLGFDKGFISAIEHGKSKFPKAKLTLLLNNPHNWDTSMLRESENTAAQHDSEDALIMYLQGKVKEQDALIRELYQQIGSLQKELELVRTGEYAFAAKSSINANVG